MSESTQSEAHFHPPPIASVVTERLGVRLVLVATAIVFLLLFLVLPLLVVFQQAFAKGWQAYVDSFSDEDAQAAIKLTLLVASIAVPFNLVFGITAAWAIAKFEFVGKSLLTTLIDLPFSVSPVVSGLIFILLFGAQGLFRAIAPDARPPDRLCRAGHRARDHLRHLSARGAPTHSLDAGARRRR